MDLTLEDLSPADRKALPHDHPLLDDYASRVNTQYALPDHTLTALKNAGERSESTGKNSLSPKGAQGVMQFMPSTAKRFDLADPTDPLSAIDAAGRYASHISKTLNTSDPGLIAAGYNAGENRATLKAGRVPDIPETQDYVTRVREFIKGRPAEIATPAKAAGFQPEDLLPEDRKPPKIKPSAEYSPVSDSGFENAAAGFGKLLTDTGRGTLQLLADAVVNPASRALVGRDLMDNRRAESAEADARDAPLMNTKAGMGGYAAGALATSALPAGLLTKAGLVTKAANLASQIPKIGGFLKLAVPASVASAGVSAVSPVAEDGDRARNMQVGAALGPLGTVFGAGAGRLAKTVPGQDVVQGAKILLDKLPGLPGLTAPSWDKALTPGGRSAVDAALKAEVPVYGSQLRTPGAELSKGRAAEQRAGFDRAIARTFGENTDDLVQAFPAASERMGKVYNGLFETKSIPLGADHLTDLAAVRAFNASRAPRFAANADVEDLVARAEAAAAQSGKMSGRDYQNALQQYKTLMTGFGKSTDTKTADYHAMESVSKLIDAMNAQAGKALSKEELQLFNTTNKQWRNMTQLEALAPRTAEGNISPKQLANLLARKRKGEFIYGKGDQELPDLARYGNTYMGLSANSPKGLVQSIKNTVAASAPYGLATLGEGALIGSQVAGEGDPHGGVLSKVTPYVAGIAAATVLNRAAANAMNPRLRAADMGRPRGALGELYNNASLTPAAALTVNALRAQDQ